MPNRGHWTTLPTLVLALVALLPAGALAGWFDGYSQEQQQQQQRQPQRQQAAAPADLYDVLGLDESATEAEIKRAYRRLSVKHHPDKGGSVAKFNELSAAYQVLSDDEKRLLYDVGGMTAVEQGAGRTDMFGRTMGVPKGPAVEVTVRVPLEDVYKGGTVRASVRRRVVCRGCRGGGAGLAKCAGCEATCPPEIKTVQRRMGPMLVNQEVEVASEERCKDEVRTLEAVIERGMPEDFTVLFERASEQSPGVVPGDVRLKLRSDSHAVFRRDGRHLTMELRISLRQALLGFERRIRHLDGHEVLIANAGISTPGMVITLPREGLPVHGEPSEFGELRVKLEVVFPKTISAAEREWIATHFDDASG